MSYIGVDLDGTLAYYPSRTGPEQIGHPIEAMMRRVRGWLSNGTQVKIVTARASYPELIPAVRSWLDLHGLANVQITNVKDFEMIELWDDKAVQVEPNTGKRVDGRSG